MVEFLLFLLGFVSFFLIVIILLQRGKGGGLAGAFGGAGGQSAFGTKAGDAFTRITVVVAVIWVLLAGISGMAMRNQPTVSKTDGLKDPVPVPKTPTGVLPPTGAPMAPPLDEKEGTTTPSNPTNPAVTPPTIPAESPSNPPVTNEASKIEEKPAPAPNPDQPAAVPSPEKPAGENPAEAKK